MVHISKCNTRLNTLSTYDSLILIHHYLNLKLFVKKHKSEDVHNVKLTAYNKRNRVIIFNC